jgi:glucan phosphorylase
METTAGGRNYSGGLGALYGDTTRTMHRLGASFLAFTPIYKNGYVRQSLTDNGVVDKYPEQDFNTDYVDTGIVLDIPMVGRIIKVKVWQNKTIDIIIYFIVERGIYGTVFQSRCNYHNPWRPRRSKGISYHR